MTEAKRVLGQLTVTCVLVLSVFCDQSCDKCMLDNKVIPDYAEKIDSSDLKICCEYTQIRCCENYAPSLLEKRPTCYFDPPSDCNFATILFFGKYEESNSTVLLWLAYNVPGCDMKTGFTGHSGNEIVIYKGPNADGGPEGHMFFVYCHEKEIENISLCRMDELKNFNVKEFAAKNDLKNPSGGLYFKVTATGQLMNSTSYSEADKCAVRSK